MSLALSSVVAFILGLGALVTVHEYGHYWVARRMGVKVLRFSIGFGKPLFRWKMKNSDTEYVIAAVPLGGYVKMLDEREGKVRTDERHLAFNNQPLWSRVAVVSAGPLANFIMAILVYALVYSVGITGFKPIVGEVKQGSIAANAGFLEKDRIIAVAGKEVRTWQQARIEMLDALISNDDFVIQVVTDSGEERNRYVNVQNTHLLKEEGDIIENLGMSPWSGDTIPVIGEVFKGGAAEQAGLKAGDRIMSMNGQPVISSITWIETVRQSSSKELILGIDRHGEYLTINVTPKPSEENGETIGLIGVKLSSGLQVLVRYSLTESLVQGVKKTISMSVLTFKMIGQLITGQASAKNISGPITIAEYAGRSASVDFRYYLDFIAFISLSLAVLNILPIPLLDGGHLLYCLIEFIKGSPVSETVEALGQRIGIVLLACLMTLALYNDVTRLLS